MDNDRPPMQLKVTDQSQSGEQFRDGCPTLEHVHESHVGSHIDLIRAPCEQIAMLSLAPCPEPKEQSIV